MHTKPIQILLKPWKKHWFPNYNLYTQTIIRRNLFYPLRVQFPIENFLPLQVPSAVTHVLFWQRYFYKVHQLQQVWFLLFEVGICYLIEVLCNSCNIALVLWNKTSKLMLEWKLVLCMKKTVTGWWILWLIAVQGLTLKLEWQAFMLACSQNGEIDFVWVFHTRKLLYSMLLCAVNTRNMHCLTPFNP